MADLVGPISPVSIGGSCYFLTVVDTASEYAWVSILKVKSQAMQQLRAIVNKIGNRIERKVKRIITNGGGEFVNQDMDMWLSEKGISHLVTTRNTPQNNGTAERMNRTIMEKARTIRIDSDLPKELWAKLVSTAVFLYNRNQKTKPFFRLWGEEPKLAHIKPVGSDVVYSVHHFQNLGKLDPWCRKGILVGFDEEMKLYRVWDPENGKVVRSRDIAFNSPVDTMGEIFTDEFEAETDVSGTDNVVGTDTSKPTMNEGGDMTREVINSQPEKEAIDNRPPEPQKRLEKRSQLIDMAIG